MHESIEVEYWVVDREGALTTPGALTDVSEYVEQEFVDPLFEVKTPPCASVAELRSTFVELLDAVVSRADELDRLLVPLGTPVHAESIQRQAAERGRIQERVLGTNFDYAKYCAGTHVHFEKRNVTDQLNVLAALDPALALCNSSPYFQGDRVADGARAYLYRKKCYEQFPQFGQLWDYVETVGQWERQLQRCFEEFREAARDAGVDVAAVNEHFSPDDTVWTPVRLRDAMPTVEWRSPDTTFPSQILRLVEDLDEVMEQVHHTNVTVEGTRGEVTSDRITLPTFDVVEEYVDAAIHDGVRSDELVAYLERMGFEADRYDPTSRHIDGRAHVTPAEARDLRARYGALLREDVRSLVAD